MKFCHNCGSHFHKTKECKEPIISCGLILIKLPYFQKLKPREYIKIDNYNFKNLRNLNKISQYMNKIKFLLIRRKHSLNYIEFIRGKYTISQEELQFKFQLMSPNEIADISILNFKNLWENVWGDKSWCKTFDKEYKESKDKFYKLKKNKTLFKLLTQETIPKYDSPEWGIPKGRRESQESNINCGIREFCEETSLTNQNFNIISKVSPIVENFTGTNNKNYKSIFYLASLKKYKYDFNIDNNFEVGDIGFFTLNEATKLIRDYHQERIKILEKTFLFAINQLEENKQIKNNQINII